MDRARERLTERGTIFCRKTLVFDLLPRAHFFVVREERSSETNYCRFLGMKQNVSLGIIQNVPDLNDPYTRARYTGYAV